MDLGLIDSRRALIGVIGLGHAGLPLAAAFVRAGFTVIGLDSDSDKVNALSSGEACLDHLGACIRVLMQSGRFEASSDFARLSEADAVLIACRPRSVPTESPTSPMSSMPARR